jgi:hypothetical protein
MRNTILALLVVLAACAHDKPDEPEYLTLRELVAANEAALRQIAVGMSREQVVQAMGTRAARTKNGVVNNPYRTNTLINPDGRYEILYYINNRNYPMMGLSDRQAMPVVLRNGVVIGWGRDALEKALDGR